jgi:hypothetical protein
MLCAWDRLLGRRAATIGMIVSLVVVLVVATTDEGASWHRRAAMCAALAPVAGSLGALAAERIAIARGELSALCAIGVSPSRAALGAILGGTALSLAGACIAASGWADLSALFPTAPPARAWMLADSGAMQEPSLGIVLSPAGDLSIFAARAPATLSTLPPGAAAFAAVALALSAIACPPWTILAETAARRAIVGTLALASMLVSFHLVGAARAHPLMLLLAPVTLLVDVLAVRYRAALRR